MQPITQEEIHEMRRRGYDPATIREAEERLSLLKRGMGIAGQIRAAFAGVTLGNGVGLREACGLDDHEDAETLAKLRSTDEKNDWRKIPLSALNNAYEALSYFDAEGMRFHLPAYLIADLQGEFNVDMAAIYTHLSDYSLKQFELLNPEQRQCIRAFLIHILDDPDYGFDREKIQSALDSYWTDDESSPAGSG